MKKRFNWTMIQKWICSVIKDAMSDEAFNDGSCFYKKLPGGVSVVIAWSNYDSYEHIEDCPFSRATKTVVSKKNGESYVKAHHLEIALRETGGEGEWSESPCYWNLWDTNIFGEDGEMEGEYPFSQFDIDDNFASISKHISKQRTIFCKRSYFY